MTRRIWNLFVYAATLFAAVELPLWLVHGYEDFEIFRSFSMVFAFIFAIDVLLQLQNPVDKKLYKKVDKKTRLRRYLRQWLVVDVLSIVPFDLLSDSFAGSPWAVIFMGLALTRVLRVFHFVPVMQQWSHDPDVPPFLSRILISLFWLVIAAHWIACGWIGMGATSPDLPHLDNYVRALYWCITTLTTIGYGDITPTTNGQMLYTILVQLIGAGVYGYIIGNLASLLTNVDVARAQHEEKLEQVHAFMRYRNVPTHLKERVNDYYDYLWSQRRGTDESEILEELPRSLRIQIALHLNKELIEQVPIFKDASDDLIRYVATHLKPAIFLPNDYIVCEGEFGEEMYFIGKGAVEVVSKDGKQIYATLQSGHYFGEISLLEGTPRTASVRAIEYCDLYYLDKETFEDTLQRFPKFAEHIGRIAAERKERY
ncbi:MAG: ion transporter [Chitinophagales bacterium]